jgi:hypothetical protein
MEKTKRGRKNEGVYKEAIATSAISQINGEVELQGEQYQQQWIPVVVEDSYESESCVLDDSWNFPIALRNYGGKVS